MMQAKVYWDKGNYKQVEKIQHVYSNVNDGIHETCDQMTKRMRANSIKSYTLGHDETIDDDALVFFKI